jgi:hypothetical protein
VGGIADLVIISDRPAEVEDRAVPGHSKGDLTLDTGGRTAVGKLVERSTRFVLFLHLGGGRSAVAVDAAIREAMATRPRELMRSVAWDLLKLSCSISLRAVGMLELLNLQTAASQTHSRQPKIFPQAMTIKATPARGLLRDSELEVDCRPDALT